MRIIHVIPSLAIGGAEKLCIDLCNTLSDQGHDVLLVRLSPTQFDEKNFRFSTLVLNEKASCGLCVEWLMFPMNGRHWLKGFPPI